jgi:hypothetical protein
VGGNRRSKWRGRLKRRSPPARYFGPGHTGTVETIFRLAEARYPERWAESAIPPNEREVWHEVKEGLLNLENISLDQHLNIRIPGPHDDRLWERFCDVTEASKSLRLMLDGESIPANYYDENGHEYAVPAKFWRGDGEIVTIALLQGAAWLDSESERDKVAYRLIRLPEAKLELVWPELVANDRPVDKTASTIEAAHKGSQEDALTPATHKAIREAIMTVYARADEQNVAIPNIRVMCKFVKILLERERAVARPTLIETLATEAQEKHNVRGGHYVRLFCGSGHTAARKNLQRSNKLIV